MANGNFSVMAPADEKLFKYIETINSNPILYMGRTCWVKLYCGVVHNKKTLESNQDSKNFKRMYNPETGGYAFGITGIESEYLGRFGGIQKIHIKWKVQGKNAFEDVATHMLAPGYSILIEWGYDDEAPKIDPHKFIGKTPSQITTMLQSLSEGKFGYNASYGIITNYDWECDDFIYTATTELTAYGALMHETKLSEQDPTSKNIKEYLAGSSYINDISYYANNIGKNDVFAATNTNIDKKFSFVQSDQDAPNLECAFVSWGFIEDKIVNANIVNSFHEINSFESTIHASSMMGTTNLKVGFAPLFYDWMTGITPDRRIGGSDCRIPNFIPAIDEKTKEISEPGFGWNKENITKTFTPFGQNLLGRVRRLMFNAKYVKDAFEKNDSLTNILHSLLDGLNSAMGNFWDFQIVNDVKHNRLTVIDVNKYTHHPSIPVLMTQYNNSFVKDGVRMGGKSSGELALTVLSNSGGKVGNNQYRSLWNNLTISDRFVLKKRTQDKLSKTQKAFLNTSDGHIKTPEQILDERDKSLASWETENRGKLSDEEYIKQRAKKIDELQETSNLVQVNVTEAQMESVNSAQSYRFDYNNNNFELSFLDQCITAFKDYKTLDNHKAGERYDVQYFLDRNITSDMGAYRLRLKESVGDNSLYVPGTLEVEIPLYGSSGWHIGNLLSIDKLPNIYLKNGYLQVFGITDSIDAGGVWTTTLKTKYRPRVDKEDESIVHAVEHYIPSVKDTSDSNNSTTSASSVVVKKFGPDKGTGEMNKYAQSLRKK